MKKVDHSHNSKWQQDMNNHVAMSASRTDTLCERTRPLWLFKWILRHRTVRNVMPWTVWKNCGQDCDVCITLKCRLEKQLTQPTANSNLGLEEAFSLPTACALECFRAPCTEESYIKVQHCLSNCFLLIKMYITWGFTAEAISSKAE